MTITLVARFPVDDAELSALHALAFGSDPSVVTPWASRLTRHALTWVGAFSEAHLAGFVQVCWDGGAHSFLLDTVVSPGHQHRGIGSALVATAIDGHHSTACECSITSPGSSYVSPSPLPGRPVTACITGSAIRANRSNSPTAHPTDPARTDTPPTTTRSSRHDAPAGSGWGGPPAPRVHEDRSTRPPGALPARPLGRCGVPVHGPS